MSRPERLLAALALCACAADAAAETTCSGSNATLSLGNYLSYSATPVDSSGLLAVTCTRSGGPPNTSVTVGLGPSFNSGSIANRMARLATGTDVLGYNLYRDANRLSVWGDTPGVDTVTRTISLANKTTDTITFTIFTRIPPLQDLREGVYSDQLLVTVDF